MAGQSYIPLQRVNPAQGFNTVPLFNAQGKWLNSQNFRFYRGVAKNFSRKVVHETLTATSQVLTVPNVTCQIQT